MVMNDINKLLKTYSDMNYPTRVNMLSLSTRMGKTIPEIVRRVVNISNMTGETYYLTTLFLLKDVNKEEQAAKASYFVREGINFLGIEE